MTIIIALKVHNITSQLILPMQMSFCKPIIDAFTETAVKPKENPL